MVHFYTSYKCQREAVNGIALNDCAIICMEIMLSYDKAENKRDLRLSAKVPVYPIPYVVERTQTDFWRKLSWDS